MNKKTELKVGIGASSILMIILTLALTSFAVLSLVSAQSDRKLTEKSKAMTAAYYAADEKVEALLAEIDAVLVKGGDAAKRNEELVKLNNTIRTDENGTINFTVAVNDIRQISVTLQILQGSPLRYRILSRRLETFGDWNPEVDIDPWIK